MRKILINMITLVATALAMSSCEKKVNDWDVDPSYAGLFRSLSFETTNIGATDVEIGYTQTVSANKYIFEFSKDSLEFNEIVKTVEILADTLTPFAPSTTPTRVVYRTIFEDLDGTSPYSVRMKGINTETGQESGYVELFFKTMAEQLFSGADISLDRITMHWPATDNVTHIVITDPINDDAEVKRVDLTASHKTAGVATITDLQPGKLYAVSIFNNDVLRGTRVLVTSGISGGEIIPVSPGDDIPALVAAALAAGKREIILNFSGDQPYNLGAVTLPSGVINVSVTGTANANGKNPVLQISSFKLSDTQYSRVIFENVDLHAISGSSFLITSDQAGMRATGYWFTNCYIQGFGNGVVRLNNAVNVGQIRFDNCRIHKNGGWGVVNVGGSEAVVDSIKFTNSTLTDLATQLMDVRVAVKKIVVQNCTFYNQNAAMSQLLRFDTNRLPLELLAGNNIISGTNSGAKLNATSYNHGDFSLPVSFAGSYRTNEFEIERDSRGFADITLFSGSATDLFVDPDAGDFRIKPNNGFGGRGTAGDPRWIE
ncbi:DUF5123 domain-containing protein [Sphingobacterium sp. DN00404]|uniref:DUF5123 domain-containing protein n=1 Tax=Sphingobacterium micropteri TaxID=2763501 RepID=A0ABR7YUW7_9SPHI|nr:DUF5123 domain-containing protein [Sphingobacterium micropteri]MBD1435075.1 DUF5123 domain-containing protein [Sphingobacterium micropteri]